jgi:hypothetical protein
MQQLVAVGVGNAFYAGSDAISRYNALQATVAQKSYHGLDLQFNYTWSKTLSNSLGWWGVYSDEEGSGEGQNEGAGNFFQNEYDPKGDYGKTTIDAASAFNGYAIYNLPFGKDNALSGGQSRGLDELTGGWSIAMDTTFRSGFAVTPLVGDEYSDYNPASASSLTGAVYVPRADCISTNLGQRLQTAQIGSSIGVLNLNANAVRDQADGQFGNCQTGSARGPSLKTADVNIIKSFPVVEGINLTFMAQFVNVTNTPVFSIPSTYLSVYATCQYCTGVRTLGPNGGGSGTVGSYGLLDGLNPGRQIELSMKLNF